MRIMQKRLLMLLFITGAVTGIFSVQAGAKTKLKNLTYTTDRVSVDAKATMVNAGKHSLQVKSSGCGYIKYTAPESRMYTITVSGLKRNKRKSLPGTHYWFRILTVNPDNEAMLVPNVVTTQGGKAKNLYFWRKTIRKGSKNLRYRKSRYGKINLEAGDTVYVYFCCNSKDSFKVKID